MTNKEIGKYGEDLAKDFLIKKGYKILEVNFHYSKVAEIDIIAEYKSTLHFVEVKTRTSNSFGAPLEAINTKKLNYIYQGALFYIKNSKKRYSKFQIDAVGIILDKDKNPEFNFIENITFKFFFVYPESKQSKVIFNRIV